MNGKDDEIAVCSACSCQMDVTVLAPFTNVECPECGVQTRVKCELDQYILRRRQGVGGMSLVFAAKDKNLGREVAIKILNEDYSMDSTRISQFEQEAMITAGISHPNVVRVYTVGKAFNRYYIAMELVSGQSLEQMMAERGAIPEDEIIPKMHQVTEGLYAAYKVNLIHRDIKPGNILIDQLNMAKIVDFGLALVTQGGVAIAEEIWATPYYVPPEALDGQPEDFRSDVYALSATMYHALAGKPPFTSETRNTQELAQIKKSIAPLKTVAPWLSDSICAVIDKGMKYEPQDRFESYEEMLEAIQFAEDSIGVEGASLPVHGSERAKRRAEVPSVAKLWIPVAVGATVLGVGGVFLVSSIIKGQAQSNDKTKVVAPVNPSKGTVKIDEELKAKVEGGYAKALAQLQEGEYNQASNSLRSLMLLQKHPEPSASLAGLHNVAVKLLSGAPAQARVAARELRQHADKAKFKKSTFGKADISRVVGQILSLSSLHNGEIKLKNSKEATAVVIFIAAMKNAEIGDWRLSKRQFEEIRDTDYSKIPRHAGFFEVYKNEASKYLADFEKLKYHQDLKHGEVKSKAQAEELKAELGQLQFDSKLKRNSVLVLNYRRKYDRLIKYFDRIENPPKQTSSEEVPKKSKTFDEFKELLAKDLKDRNYKKVAERLKREKFSEIQDEKKKWQFMYLCLKANTYLDSYAKLLDNKVLRRSIVDGEGNEYRALRGSEAGAEVSKDGAVILVKWSDVRPASLLALHTDLVKNLPPESDDKNEMLKNAICYAYLNGLDEMVENALAKLPADDEEFKKKWSDRTMLLSH